MKKRRRRTRVGGEIARLRCRIVKRLEEDIEILRQKERGQTERDIGREARQQHRKRIKWREKIKGW